MRLRALFIFVCISFHFHESFAQAIKRAGAKAGVATILAHSSDLKPISQSTPIGFKAAWQWMGTGQKSWEVCNCFYYLGLEAFYYNFDHPSVLGSAVGIAGTFEPILWRRDRWSLSLASGIGLSYLNRVHDPVENPNNLFFSQPLSFLLFVAPIMEYRVSANWSAQVGLSYNHISNGGQKQPNKGMNFPGISLGVSRYLSSQDLPDYEKAPIAPEWMFYTEAGFTTKGRDGGSGRGAVLSMAGEAFRSVTTINALGAGLDLGKDYSLEQEQSFWPSLTVAPFVAHHFTLGRIDFSQWMALYLQKGNGNDSHRFYQRYVLRYQLNSSLYVGVGLKAHGHVAENIDLRLGWKF
jgi:hypothetical protein